jgi:3-phosphoshikimate 1-carboxyvinyltransferase
MPLPDLIEILPLAQPVEARLAVPGSKSLTNRALVLAALAPGETTLTGALWSEDTQVMVEALGRLGFAVRVEADSRERCNRTITVQGMGGRVPAGGPRERPMDLFVGNAGTAARFLTALLCLGEGTYRLHGVARMHERPQAPLFVALRRLGYRLDSPNDRLPAVIHGAGPRPGRCRITVEPSSQFASALLLCGSTAGWEVEVAGEDAEESPYVEMTRRLVEAFPRHGGVWSIEPDASSGSYFWAAKWLLHPAAALAVDWPVSRWQIDADFNGYWPLPPELSRAGQLGDSIMTAIVLAPFGARPTRFTHLGRLRVQECERVAALRTELTKCGAQVVETGDTLEVFPSLLGGAEIETYNDHRMAMCFAILGLKVPGVRIKNPACVKKTFPNFFQKLAAAPPHGLGATVCNRAGDRLALEELFAD